MNKKKKQFKNTINAIIRHIKSSPILLKTFYTKTKNCKYDIYEKLYCVLLIVKLGISFRNITYLSEYASIYWTTIYKFYRKLIKFNIIEDTYKKIVNKYLKSNKNTVFLTDTTLIQNKMGIDKIGFNPQLCKHKTSKISYITSKNGVPIDIYIASGNNYDSKILLDQLNQTNIVDNCNSKNNILLGDAGYDSNKIRELLKNKQFGKLICHRNKRNIKDPIKLKKLDLNQKDKTIIKKRIKVEHVFSHLKSFKRISLRYDKLVNNYYNFVLLATLMIVSKKISRNKSY